MSTALSLKPSYYEALKRLTLELAGVKLGENHEFLVETRLAAMARREGFENMPDLVDELFLRGQTRLAVNVVSALLERDIRFFEDKAGFVTLENEVLPRLMRGYQGGVIQILCFGCGSGQDVISTAIVMDKICRQDPDIDYHITGVDYPSHGLTRAKAGRYTHFEAQRGLPARDLVNYFHNQGEDWCVNPELLEKVTFKDHHLLSDVEPLGTFSLVQFRNNLERYSPPAQVRMLRNLSLATVSSTGYLMLGTCEDLNGLNFGLDAADCGNGFYKKQDEAIIPPTPEDDGRKKPNGRTTFEHADAPKAAKPDLGKRRA